MDSTHFWHLALVQQALEAIYSIAILPSCSRPRRSHAGAAPSLHAHRQGRAREHGCQGHHGHPAPARQHEAAQCIVLPITDHHVQARIGLAVALGKGASIRPGTGQVLHAFLAGLVEGLVVDSAGTG